MNNRDIDVSDDISDGVFAYIREIAQTPQLTHKQERKLFEAFSASTQEISGLLKRLPPQILAKAQSTSGRGRGNKTKSSNGRWWSPMEIRTVLERC